MKISYLTQLKIFSLILTIVFFILLKTLIDYNYPRENNTLLEKILKFIIWSIVFIILFYLTHILVFLISDSINYRKESGMRMEKLRKQANNMRNDFIEKARAREQMAMIERAKARELRFIAERNELMKSLGERNYIPID
jgi:uncharacterized membrane protein (DUF106 family)